MENQDWATGPPGRRAAGPPGRRAVAGRGPWTPGPSGRRAAGPWRAVGRGPLGRGPALAKPFAFDVVAAVAGQVEIALIIDHDALLLFLCVVPLLS